MAIQYINRKNKTFYLHQGVTKTGKPKYFFSMKPDGVLVNEIPDGFEIYETPNSQVLLRRIQPRLITQAEENMVRDGIKLYSQLQCFQIDIKKKTITIFQADQDLEELGKFLEKAEVLLQCVSYSPVMQFVLVNEEKRLFRVERYCFLGQVDDWIVIGSNDTLQNLIKNYVKHLGQESFFQLF